jgi:hypothetical protein
LVGVALVAGGGWWAYAGAYVPMTWPRTSAEVVSSRVINPGGPSKHEPELVFRYAAAGQIRERKFKSAWSSGSYDIVQRFVEEYPAGRRLVVGVNPADPDDIAYDLQWSFNNLIGPIIVGGLGVLFVGIGLVSVMVVGRTPRRHDPPADPFRYVGWVFRSIGVVVFVAGGWMSASQTAVRRDWGSVTATVVSAEAVSSSVGLSGGRQQRGQLLDSSIAFRYVVDGKTYENATRYGVASSDADALRARLAAFAPGTSHTIRYRPGDPNIIRFSLDSWWATFGLEAGLMGMGLLFVGFAQVPRLLRRLG